MILTKEQENKFINFISPLKIQYDKDEYDFIMNHYNSDDDGSFGHPISQLYSKLGFFGDKDFYKDFLKVLMSNFDINTNILEVGGGAYPVLSEYISNEQIKGSITCYDRDLLMIPDTKIKLVNKEFSLNTDISKYDLLTGYMPCDATKTILLKSCVQEKDFIIGLCGCVHDIVHPTFYGFSCGTYEEQLDFYYDIIDKNKSSDLEIKEEFLDKSYEKDYPIIIGKHKKKTIF